jgi:hypothetical protein
MALLRAQVGTYDYTHGKSKDYRAAVYGLDIEEHGGECCGMRHLHGFPDNEATPEERENWLKNAVFNCIESYGDAEDVEHLWRSCIEVVLNEHQLSDWCAILEKQGFKQVFSFLNSNSGNECHVFMLETNRP